MVGDAICQLVSMGLKFDETKGDNPFAYYTTIITNSFVARLNREKKQRMIKEELREKSSFSTMMDIEMENQKNNEKEIS